MGNKQTKIIWQLEHLLANGSIYSVILYKKKITFLKLYPRENTILTGSGLHLSCGLQRGIVRIQRHYYLLAQSSQFREDKENMISRGGFSVKLSWGSGNYGGSFGRKPPRAGPMVAIPCRALSLPSYNPRAVHQPAHPSRPSPSNCTASSR